MSKYYIGIDVGGGTIKFGIFDEKKKLIGKHAIVTPKYKKDAEKQFVKYIIDSLKDYIKTNTHGMTKGNLAGVGFAIPGPVVNNQIIRAVNINWKKHYDVIGPMKRAFGKKLKVTVGNDANVAAIGEYKISLKSKYKSICLLTLGTGIGTGIIIDGKVIEGKTGIAGEVSHLKVDFSKDAEKCACGNVGCLETVTSGAGIAKLYNRLYKTNSAKGAKDVIEAAKKGDKKALASLNLSFDYLSSVMAMILLVYEPEAFIIGGGVSNEGDIITKLLDKKIKERVCITKHFPKILLAKLKNDAGIYGAVATL